MKISLNWLKEYVKFDLQPEEAEKILSSIGLEVEAMEEVEMIPGGLKGVVVAKVVECVKHPDADKLKITKVDAGTGELLQVVCGAPNVAEGQKVLLATVGTNLRFSNGEDIKIKKSKIRGVESNGMICAEDELGIGTSHEGIMVLDESALPGTSASDYLKLESDIIFEIGLTPNRVDAASHIGVARDLAAWLKFNNSGGELTIPEISGYDSLPKSADVEPATVKVESPEGAPRYMGVTLTGIKIGPSPEWLKERLNSIGLKPINNVVDVTNFVLHETGHPLHAFDLEKVKNREIVVRTAQKGEKLETLDGVVRELRDEDLMICDKSKPMCIAGIFGGADSGVSESTTSIFLESAWFNPVYIRKSSKYHSLKTDASFRFERGCDPMILPYALKRAAILLNEVAGAKICGEIVDVVSEEFERAFVSLDFDRMRRFIGKSISNEDFVKILGYLDFEITKMEGNVADVLVPSYRVDVTRECDIVEDLLRIYGYNNVELPQNVKISINTTPRPDPEKIRGEISTFLASNGFFETMNNSLTKSDYYAKLKSYPEERLVYLLNPLSSDLNAMRQTLILNGLEVIAWNINRQQSNLKLFELGNVYSKVSEKDGSDLSAYNEEFRISLFITGNSGQSWRSGVVNTHYFTLKGYLELLLRRFGIDVNDLTYEAAPYDIFAEGLSYFIGEKRLADLGTVNSSLLKMFGIKQPVFAAEISWKVLLNAIKKQKILYKELPRFPEVRRDLALLVNEDVTFAELRKCAFKIEKRLLKQVVLFDVYRGDKIPEGKKQYALSFTLQDPEKTLTDKYVEEIMSRLLSAFSDTFGAQLR